MTSHPDDSLAGMARWLLDRRNQLAVHPAGGEAVDEICAAVRDARRVTDRQWRRFTIGTCPMLDCTGSLSAVLTTDPDGESWILCDTDEEHAWPEERWLFLGNWIHDDRMAS